MCGKGQMGIRVKFKKAWKPEIIFFIHNIIRAQVVWKVTSYVSVCVLGKGGTFLCPPPPPQINLNLLLCWQPLVLTRWWLQSRSLTVAGYSRGL